MTVVQGEFSSFLFGPCIDRGFSHRFQARFPTPIFRDSTDHLIASEQQANPETILLPIFTGTGRYQSTDLTVDSSRDVILYSVNSRHLATWAPLLGHWVSRQRPIVVGFLCVSL